MGLHRYALEIPAYCRTHTSMLGWYKVGWPGKAAEAMHNQTRAGGKEATLEAARVWIQHLGPCLTQASLPGSQEYFR